MQYLPTVGLTSNKGWEGQGSKYFASEATEKIFYDGKAKVGDSSERGKANPCGLAGRFVEKTTGCIDLRLT